MLSGCTALLWGGNKVTESHTVKVTQIKDNVTGVFQYDNLAASVVQGSSSKSLIIPSAGVAFMGEKNIYILTRGATELLSLNKVADKVPLISGTDENTLKLKLVSPKKGEATVHFMDTLLVEVNKKHDDLSPEDIAVLKQSGFQDEGRRYLKKVSIEGVIIPRKNLNYQFTDTESLGRKYTVEFYNWDGKTNLNLENLATNVVLTPLAAAADIVFFPISLQFLRLISRPDWG
jgi:hypothetical protein